MYQRSFFYVLFSLPLTLSIAIALTAQQYDVQFRGEPNGQGWLVRSVDAGGAATRIQSVNAPSLVGALEAGDLIVAINGMPVGTAGQYQQAISTLVATNGRVQMRLRDVRTGVVSDWVFQARATAGTTVNKPPLTPSTNAGQPVNAQYELKLQGSIVAGQGLQVTAVTNGGPATRMQSSAQAGFSSLENGDLIIAINGRSVTSPAEYQSAMASLGSTGGRATIDLVDIRTGGQSQFVTQADIVSGTASETNSGAGKIHVLLIGMSGTTVAGFNSSVTQSIDQLTRTVSTIAPARLGRNSNLIGTQCTAQNIVNSINNLQVGSNDSVFVYYIGHGAFDAAQGHFLDFDAGQPDLPRNAVTSALANKNARLTVFISESCNQLGTLAIFGLRGEEPTREGRSALEILLSDYRGVIDVNSTDQGQLGWGTSQAGGFFTAAFTALLQSGTVSDWDGLINETGSNANARFGSMRTNELQKLTNDPTAMSDPDKISLKQSLQNQIAMTPKVFQMNVSRN